MKSTLKHIATTCYYLLLRKREDIILLRYLTEAHFILATLTPNTDESIIEIVKAKKYMNRIKKSDLFSKLSAEEKFDYYSFYLKIYVFLNDEDKILEYFEILEKLNVDIYYWRVLASSDTFTGTECKDLLDSYIESSSQKKEIECNAM